MKPETTMRQTFLLSFNGQPLEVCHYEYSSATREHGTCHDFQTATVAVPFFEGDLVAGQVTEFVNYDGTQYVRVGDETTWTSTPIQNYDPNVTLIESVSFPFADITGILSQIGPVTVGTIPTTQYQYWVTDSEWNTASGGQMVYDLFLSNDGSMIKDQASGRGTIANLGTGELQAIWGYGDFNVPITVSPPLASQIR